MFHVESNAIKKATYVRISILYFLVILGSFFLPQYERRVNFDPFHRTAPIIKTMVGIASFGWQSFLSTILQAPVLCGIYLILSFSIIGIFLLIYSLFFNKIMSIDVIVIFNIILSIYVLLFQYQYNNIFGDKDNVFIPNIYITLIFSIFFFIIKKKYLILEKF